MTIRKTKSFEAETFHNYGEIFRAISDTDVLQTKWPSLRCFKLTYLMLWRCLEFWLDNVSNYFLYNSPTPRKILVCLNAACFDNQTALMSTPEEERELRIPKQWNQQSTLVNPRNFSRRSHPPQKKTSSPPLVSTKEIKGLIRGYPFIFGKSHSLNIFTRHAEVNSTTMLFCR